MSLLLYDSNPTTPGIYSRDMKTHVHTKTYIQSSSCSQCSKLELTQMSISWGTDKQNVVQCLSAIQRNELDISNHTDESQKPWAEGGKPDSKGFVL